jgi:hypothetical protein
MIDILSRNIHIDMATFQEFFDAFEDLGFSAVDASTFS